MNLAEQTMFFLGYVVPIESVGEASIKFGGMQTVDYGFSVAIRGNIDRATGRMDAALLNVGPHAAAQRSHNTAVIRYDVVCKPSSN